MKLSEVIAALEKDPSKKFEAASYSDKVNIIKVDDNGYYRMDIYHGDRELIPQELGGGNFNGNVGRLDNWKEVEQPVTWQEAIKAWANFKRVRCELDGKTWTYDYQLFKSNGILALEDGNAMSPLEITEGKWFIEAKS